MDARRILRVGVASLWAVGLLSDIVYAQGSVGGIRGIVRDGTGGVLAGVTVEAASPSRIGPPAVEVTDVRGDYRFENLPVGIYSVTFTLQGFSTVKQQGIRV